MALEPVKAELENKSLADRLTQAHYVNGEVHPCGSFAQFQRHDVSLGDADSRRAVPVEL